MKNSMKKLFTILFVLLFACKIFAADGVVTFVKGKVEVKRGNSWVALKVGDKVAQSEVINTGFQSEAKVKLMNNVLYLGPVTRVTLSTLSSSSDKDKVNVYLSTGTIRSKVNRTDTKRVSYTVRTPIAVASVRGTDFINYGPTSVDCLEGTVGVTNTERLSIPKKSDKDKDDAEDEDDKKDDDLEDSIEDEKEDKTKTETETETEDVLDDSKDNELPDSDDVKDDFEPELTEEEIENIILDNLDKFADGENVPGGEQTITKDQGITIDNFVGMKPGSSNVENKISDTTSKVSNASEKESAETEAPSSSKPIVEEQIVQTSTGTIIITVVVQ